MIPNEFTLTHKKTGKSFKFKKKVNPPKSRGTKYTKKKKSYG